MLFRRQPKIKSLEKILAVEFKRTTGLTWPKAAKVIVAEDSLGGFQGDGSLKIIFDVETEILTVMASEATTVGC